MLPSKSKKYNSVCGVLLKNVKINANFLLQAGYKQVFNHTYSRRKYDEQWVTGLTLMGLAQFPRFHILRNGAEWFIHYDFFEGNGHKTIVRRSPAVDIEIQRLEKLKSKSINRAYAWRQ